MKAIICEPEKPARVEDVGESLKDLQKIVGGYIETFPASPDGRGPVVGVCDEEGKFKDYKASRVIRNSDGRIIDVIMGTFFIVRIEGEEFVSLRDEDIEKFMKIYGKAEYIDVDFEEDNDYSFGGSED